VEPTDLVRRSAGLHITWWRPSASRQRAIDNGINEWPFIGHDEMVDRWSERVVDVDNWCVYIYIYIAVDMESRVTYRVRFLVQIVNQCLPGAFSATRVVQHQLKHISENPVNLIAF